MPKSYHGQIIPLTFEVRATRPLRDSEVIDTAADRLLPATWLSDDGNYYVYPGMITVCKDTGVIYTYIGRENNPTDIRNPLLWYKGNIPEGTTAIHIGPEPPDDPSVIWVDTSGEALPNQEGAIPGIRSDISVLQSQVAQLMNIIKYGVLGGDSNISANSLISQTATPINPNTGLPDPTPQSPATSGGSADGSETLPPPLGGGSGVGAAPTGSPTFTIPHLVLKTDTRANFMANVKNLIENEIVLVTDAYTDTSGRTQPSLCGWMNGKLVRFSTTTAAGGSTDPDNPNPPTDPDMTQQEIEALFFTKLGLQGPDQKNYTVNVNADGNLVLFPADNYDNDITAATALLGKLVITEVFFGGEGTAIDSCAAATHNFVEIANLTTADINLNGLYLCYYNPRTVQWFTCPLYGVARANTTFLVRGAQCAVPSNDNLHVPDYDIQWLAPDGAPIQFSRQGGSIYLTYSQLNESGERCLYDPSRSAWVSVASFSPTSIYNKDVQQPGYIDLFGAQVLQNVFSEQNPIQVPVEENILDCVFFRFNGQDVTTSTIVAYASRNTTSIWCYCNFARQTTAANPYFTDIIKQRLTPAPSRAAKTFFGTRSVFSHTRANYLNCTFGRHATSGTGYGADRCFTWVSCGYHDEYLQYRKVSNSTSPVPDASPSGSDTAWLTIQSITADNAATVYNNDRTISTYIKIYARKRWVTSDSTAVTTHRVILRGLSEGTYEYRVHRPSDPTYASDTLSFVVKADSTAATFNVVQTSDQQGFTFMEYQAWAQSAHAISQQVLPDFTINTGDLTQSGNRESEWIDYYNGRHPLRNIVEMPTVGNNDLGPVNTYDFRTQSKNKVSAKYFQYLYTFDLDPDNSAYFRYVCDSEINDALVGDVISFGGREFTYYMPSMYSFDFGAYHFICLNSEFYTLADDTNMGVYSLYYNDKTIAASLKASAYYQQYKWLVEDVRKAKAAGKRLVVFCHEIPFNITAFDGTNNAERTPKPASYSELNTDFTTGIPYAGDTASNNYKGGYAYSEFFQLNDIKLCLGGHKHTYSLSYPIKERVSGSGATRTVDSNNPIVDKTNYTTRTDGVVYLMSQATGYKLSSNNDKPCTTSPWLYKWFPYNTVSKKVNPGQQYPMFNHLTFATATPTISINSYYIDGVWYHPDAATAITYNINTQHPASVHPIDGVTNFKVFY